MDGIAVPARRHRDAIAGGRDRPNGRRVEVSVWVREARRGRAKPGGQLLLRSEGFLDHSGHALVGEQAMTSGVRPDAHAGPAHVGEHVPVHQPEAVGNPTRQAAVDFEGRDDPLHIGLRERSEQRPQCRLRRTCGRDQRRSGDRKVESHEQSHHSLRERTPAMRRALEQQYNLSCGNTPSVPT